MVVVISAVFGLVEDALSKLAVLSVAYVALSAPLMQLVTPCATAAVASLAFVAGSFAGFWHPSAEEEVLAAAAEGSAQGFADIGAVALRTASVAAVKVQETEFVLADSEPCHLSDLRGLTVTTLELIMTVQVDDATLIDYLTEQMSLMLRQS